MARHVALLRTLALWKQLQGGKRTLYDLEEMFNVDTRTIRRDIEVLRKIGVPIRHERGRRLGKWWAERRAS